jgi:fatty acid desaturase
MTAGPSPSFSALERDLSALRAEMEAAIGPEDFDHLRAIERAGRLCTALGYATAWVMPNPLSAVLLAHGNTVRWAAVAHLVAHRAYDRVPDLPERYRSDHFAAGARRYVDWLDWILPDAWRWEHNALHHVRTGDPGDPDFVQRNTDWLRRSGLPMPLRYAVVGFFACTWKLLYYAPNTFQLWRRKTGRRRGEPGDDRVDDIRYLSVFNPFTEEGRAFLKSCVLPRGAVKFVALPALFAPLGPWAVWSVLVNSLMGEVLANIESFLLIVPGHAAADLPCFDGRPGSRGEFLYRQIVGTANYRTGGPLRDFAHAWMNYHIEHHLFPDLPLRKYEELQDRLRQICEAHGLPYRQESLLRRAWKAVEIMVGAESMSSAREEASTCPA